MKFAFSTSAAPGNDLSAKCASIARAGCDGVEAIIFSETNLSQWQKELRKGAQDHGLETPVVIIGGLELNKTGQMGWVKEALQAISELEAGVLVTPEYRSQNPLPLLPPYPLPPQDEQENVDRAIEEMAEIAANLKVNLLFEPISPFQTRFWRDVDTVITLCKKLNNPFIGITLDFWVMNLTEVNINQSIKNAGEFVKHIHLADNNRLLPGNGHIDFQSGLLTLKEIGYAGWYSYECAVLGDFTKELNDNIKSLRNLVDMQC